MVATPVYRGDIAFLPDDINCPAYFKTVEVSKWSLENFTMSTGLTKQAFLESLSSISRIRRLPDEIQTFTWGLVNFYEGVFGQEMTEIANNRALKTVNRELLSSKEHLIIQKEVDTAIERDKVYTTVTDDIDLQEAAKDKLGHNKSLRSTKTLKDDVPSQTKDEWQQDEDDQQTEDEHQRTAVAGKSSNQGAVRTSVLPSSLQSTSSSITPPSLKKKKQTDNDGETHLNSRKKRFAAMDPFHFWKLRSGRTVEEVLYLSSLNMNANLKVRSYTIDFACEKTKAVFTEDEWKEMEELNDFQLPKLPESTEHYLREVRKALVKGEHVASVPVPQEDRVSCELMLRSFLSWTQLYTTKPCPFGDKDLSESFWCREAWPPMKSLLADVDRITMIDGEKAGLESGKRRNKGRKLDTESSAQRKQAGRKVDLVARDTINNRDWFIIESLKEWDEFSTKFLRELDITLFKDLHLIASHRIQEQPHVLFRKQARFFSIYSGAETVKLYEDCLNDQFDDDTDEWEGASDGEWLYDYSQHRVHDETLGSSPIDYS
ncbi:hypothetical protein BG004_000709 [Podila humilis]|nr:hypothetical protein BG004_000709 [Podila humilis]